MQYTAVIRTLGTAGEKYQTLLNSLAAQTIQPTAILVYIAEGHPIPKETIGMEQYIYVKKGMVSQRALQYEEVATEYILFLDDDVYLPPEGVEILYKQLKNYKANVISPDVFHNHKRSFGAEILMTLSGRMKARRWDNTWGYKVLPTGGYSYNKKPNNYIYISQTNSGPCFLCKKEDFLKIRFEEEAWLDKMTYPIGEDQVMYYKMYLIGLKQLTLFHSGIEHLDAGSTLTNTDKVKQLLEADCYFKTIFWHRFIQGTERNKIKRIWNILCFKYYFTFTFFSSWLKGENEILQVKRQGIKKAYLFLHSEEYRLLPKIIRCDDL